MCKSFNKYSINYQIQNKLSKLCVKNTLSKYSIQLTRKILFEIKRLFKSKQVFLCLFVISQSNHMFRHILFGNHQCD